MLRARRFLVSGRVQGVGFRYFAYDLARQEGLTGFVRNLADGRVEAEAEGDRDALGRFEAGLRTGPRGARVEQVEVTEILPTGHARGFTIAS